MRWTDAVSQIHSTLSHTTIRLHREKNFAQAEWAATPVVLDYELRSLVPPLQLDLVTLDYRRHGRSHVAWLRPFVPQLEGRCRISANYYSNAKDEGVLVSSDSRLHLEQEQRRLYVREFFQ
jgi:hypothetical protein